MYQWLRLGYRYSSEVLFLETGCPFTNPTKEKEKWEKHGSQKRQSELH